MIIPIFVFIFGSYFVFILLIIGFADVQFRYRISSDHISRQAVQRFIADLHFPVTLLYGGTIGWLLELESDPDRLVSKAKKFKKLSRWKMYRGFLLPGFLCIGVPLYGFSVGLLYSAKQFDRIMYGIGICLLVSTLFIVRPWRFGHQLQAYEHKLKEADSSVPQ